MKASTLFISTATLVARIPLASAKCNLCGDNPIPENGLLREKHGISCRNLFDELMFMEGGTAACNRVQLAAFQTGCCNDEYIPENICTICPDGSDFQASVSIPGSPTRRELTCADLASEESFLDFFTTPGQCSDTFLQRSAAWCQCPGHEVKCHLCPNRKDPENLSKMEKVLYGWDCRSFQYVSALLNEGECVVASEILDFDAAAFCCDDVEPPNLCSLCPAGQEVADPEKKVPTEYGMMKCADIEESLQMIPSEESCSLVRQSVNPGQCCSFPGGRSAGYNTVPSVCTVFIGLLLFSRFL